MVVFLLLCFASLWFHFSRFPSFLLPGASPRFLWTFILCFGLAFILFKLGLRPSGHQSWTQPLLKSRTGGWHLPCGRPRMQGHLHLPGLCLFLSSLFVLGFLLRLFSLLSFNVVSWFMLDSCLCVTLCFWIPFPLPYGPISHSLASAMQLSSALQNSVALCGGHLGPPI